MNTRKIGAKGELVVMYYLKKWGYKILGSNWYCKGGELDIIAFNEVLVFIEVKTVSNFKTAYPYELFNRKKQACLRRSINFYLVQNPQYFDRWQMDLVCVLHSNSKCRILHYRNLPLDLDY